MKQYKILAQTLKLTENEWQNLRRRGIGGSDAGAILGFNNYSSPHEIYLSKTDGIDRDLSGNEAVYWGKRLEAVVAAEFEKRSGKKVKRVNAALQSIKYPFMLANVDRMVIGENAVLECKTANQYFAADWDGGEVPPAYICQCQHYMAVTGAECCYIACLVGGQRFVYKPIERDGEFIEYLIQKERDFWENNVLKNVPPPISGMDCDSEYLKNKYPESCGGAVMMTGETEAAAYEYIDLCAKENEIKEAKKRCANAIKQYMGEAEQAVGQGITASWKTTAAEKADVRLLKEKYPEVYAQCIKKSKTRRFTVKKER